MAPVLDSADTHTVLLVDDDEANRLALGELLQEEGYQVVTACHGKEALEYLRGGGIPCLILLDLMMPVMNGWEFRAKQLEDPVLRRIPVVVMSAAGAGLRRGRDNPHDLGADVLIISKPPDIDLLLREVRRICLLSLAPSPSAPPLA